MLENVVGAFISTKDAAKRNYAINVLRRLESMKFATKALAEQYFNITKDVLYSDLCGLDVQPVFRETIAVGVKETNTHRRYYVWKIRVKVIEEKVNVLN